MRHGTIENELGPIGASLQIDTRLLLAVFKSLIPIEPGSHVQKVLNRDGLLSVIDIRNMAIDEKIQHWMIETVEQAVLVDHPEKSACNRLCGREYLVRNLRRVGSVIGLCDNPPMTHDQQTVKAVTSAIADKLGERCRIHALLFRRSRQPSLGWPC